MDVVVLGAGISGHTAALVLRRKLGKKHTVTVVSPNAMWNWIPSNIWVGVGEMSADDVTFALEPVYERVGVRFHQARATELFPEGTAPERRPFVRVSSTRPTDKGRVYDVPYDFLVNATGPKLNFAATEGLGPEHGHTLSVCTVEHARDTAERLAAVVAQMKDGANKTFVIGTGHGLCTCEGAAFEYVFNLEHALRRAGVRDRARVVFLTNEAELGDFGVGGLALRMGGYVTPSKVFAESLFVERGVDWIVGAHVHRIDAQALTYETLDGETATLDFDFAMLLPPFTGVPLKAFDASGAEITSKLFSPAGFMKVDADYTQKPFEAWLPEDWPKTYQTAYPNLFAVGIAFAPPHQISRPRRSANGTLIAPAPPRTGMPSAIMGRAVALSIVDMIDGSDRPTHTASMADLGAACIASAGADKLSGSAVAMTMYPIIPDHHSYPESGRSLAHTTGEIGTAGHWIKKLLHHAFIYKAKAKPLWWLIPE